MILYQAVIVLWLGSEVIIGLTRAAPFGFRRQDRWSGQALVGFLAVSVWLGLLVARLVPSASISDGRSLVFGLGIAVALLGIALRWWAVLTLGRFFTTRVMTRPDQTVVQSGPYRWVRHPSYTGALLTVFGVVLCNTNWLSLTCFVIALPGFAYRIRVEERALLTALGEPYRDYMRRTKRLVPFVV
ncbi:MAG TPA: isoprenylcysteine carboxylmethyltransferase family protein [Candidatus Dormibacteraeota bacterium]|nr:isoprenylcysteine carboxylmethyltransferase family protein [Candidatus Dormibacteraeota bacterium]